MKTMSTVQIGDGFEGKVVSELTRMIENEEFFFAADRSILTPKKGLWSRDRNANIIFDVVIESFMAGAVTPSLIIVTTQQVPDFEGNGSNPTKESRLY